MKINNLRINGKCFKYNKYKIQKKLNELYKYDSFISYDELLFDDSYNINSFNHRSTYKYIISKDINKDNLKKAYSILMNGLLDNNDLINTSYYREGNSYMMETSILGDSYIKNTSPIKLEESMNQLFEYINTSKDDEFIKSQILQLYIILLQPYYDGNSRIGRVTSIWNMLNTNNSNYISYIKGIFLNKNKYYTSIKESKKNLNITSFLSTMLDININEKRKDKIISKMNLNYYEDSIIRLLFKNSFSFQELVNKIRLSYNEYDDMNVRRTLKSLKEKDIITLNKNNIKLK